ncbi:carbohydrate ABC transporter substrate-binding protein, CUT1 family [Georgenia satyanarayanai]|uniref:Carbohydrate ABC transporter substrate-binding protein, CUT1 family n=1 Tax=Georgenia satyanarayanai TaxID=860221 RepID=A0A2Y9AQC8_9MICO|nr:extracellular solute-binding protein [Georgenia satyanarayanai]PYF97808.1 carbohydrate ABC transporter substrate-binding protein (CUT1 family) [Georgenia satyanarayanai]SSA45548.1 carbohydrate ABC transporter substrate-binding protein, CUT1 family [Georgenia satyanarayanai]
MDRRARARAGAALAIAAVLAACGEPAGDNAGTDATASMSTVTFRLWDDAAAAAYRESFDAFNAVHRDIHVEVEVVPEAGYSDRTASDLAEGTMADVFWTTSDAVAALARAGDVLEVRETLGEDVGDWEPAVTALYTDDDGLWAVPQLWESTVLLYNTVLVEEVGVDAAALTWHPDAAREKTPAGGAATPAPADTLRQAVRSLTLDEDGRTAGEKGFTADDVAQYGFNTDLTAPAVWLPYLAQLGGVPETGDDLSLTGPEARDAFGYLAELPAVPPVATPDRALFADGRLALFQSTSAEMRRLVETDVEWGVAPVPGGPGERVSVVDGVGAAANAATENPDATAEVLLWLASTDGQSALASHGVGVPAATGAQDLYLSSWSDRGVDVTAAVAPEATVTAASGPRAREVLESVRPILEEMFRGALPLTEALSAAQSAAEQALGS